MYIKETLRVGEGNSQLGDDLLQSLLHDHLGIVKLGIELLPYLSLALALKEGGSNGYIFGAILLGGTTAAPPPWNKCLSLISEKSLT